MMMNMNVCLACGVGGVLLLCDTCSNAFHRKCVGLNKIPDGAWKCPVCIGIATHDIFRKRREEYRRRRFPVRAETAAILAEQSLLGLDTLLVELDNHEELTCAFCKGCGTDPPFGDSYGVGAAIRMNDDGDDDSDAEAERAGLIGPFYDSKHDRELYAHFLCAMWSPCVYFDPVVGWRNVVAEVERGNRLPCSECRRHGATIGCAVDECPRSYHLKCARSAMCQFDKDKFHIFCPLHSLRLTLAKLGKLGKLGKRKLRPSASASTLTTLDKQTERVEQKSCVELWDLIAQSDSTAVGDVGNVDAHMPPPDDAQLVKLRLESRLAARVIARQSSGELTWDDVGGLRRHVHALKEVVVLPLLYPEVFRYLGVEPPRGLLLYGPPGTGKTLLVRVLADVCSRIVKPDGTQCRVSVFVRKGADVLSKFYGETEMQLRVLFRKASMCAPSIIVFDEIDGLAPVRSPKQNQVHSSIVTTLLSEMDGLDSRGQVFVIGTTNRLDAIDPALRRPGRFDREMLVPLPDQHTRLSILRIHTKSWAMASQQKQQRVRFDGTLVAVSGRTGGFSGADLRALCVEAALVAAHRTHPNLLSDNDRTGPANEAFVLKQFAVTRGDFEAALQLVAVSRGRAANQPGAQASWIERALLGGCVERAITTLFPLIRSDGSTTDFGPGRVLFVGADRDVASNRDAGNGAVHVASGQLLLDTALEDFHVLDCSLPALGACHDHSRNRDHDESLASACVKQFRLARTAKRSVLYFPDMDQWWSAAPAGLRGVFLSQLRDLQATTSMQPFNVIRAPQRHGTTHCPTTRILLVATCSRDWNSQMAYELRIPMELFRYFHASVRVRVPVRWSREQRNALFQRIAERCSPNPSECNLWANSMSQHSRNWSFGALQQSAFRSLAYYSRHNSLPPLSLSLSTSSSSSTLSSS